MSDLNSAETGTNSYKAQETRPWYKKKIYIIPIAIWVILMIVVISNVGNGNSSTTNSDASITEETNSSSDSSASEAPAGPVIVAQSLSGFGDDVLMVDIKDPAIITFSCPACTSNTVLKTDGADSLLVNEIGAYSGQHLVNSRTGSIITTLTVNADSDWTIDIADLSSVPVTNGPASGHGDSVVYFGNKFKAAAITNIGESNFVIHGYGSSYPELAVNEIGSYQGTVELTGPGFVQVNSTGDWTITPQ